MEDVKTIGPLLIAAREESGFTLKQISAKTKINLSVLKAIESEDLKKLPNITYVKGFVKTYAKAVGANPTTAIQALDNTYSRGNEPNLEITKENIPAPQHHLNEINEASQLDTENQVEEIKEGLIAFIQGLFTKKVLFSSLLLVAIFITIKTATNWFSNLTSESVAQIKKENSLELSKPTVTEEVQITTSTVAEKPQITEDTPSKPKVEETKLVQVKKEVEEIKVVPTPKKEIPKLKDGKLPYRSFRPAPLKLFVALPNASEVNDKNLLPDSVKNSFNQNIENVYIVAHEADTWISYKIDNNPIKRYVLREGRRVLLKGNRILLFVGNYNKTKVFYNNMFVAARTTSGVKSLIFPPAAAKDLVLPLFPSYKGIPYEASEYMKNMAKKEVINP